MDDEFEVVEDVQFIAQTHLPACKCIVDILEMLLDTLTLDVLVDFFWRNVAEWQLILDELKYINSPHQQALTIASDY